MIKKVLLVLFLILVAFGFGLTIDSATNADYVCDEVSVVVEAGDTVWDIVNKHCTGAVLDAVDDTVEMYGDNLQLWDIITLPKNN